jgi:hypothetical protein
MLAWQCTQVCDFCGDGEGSRHCTGRDHAKFPGSKIEHVSHIFPIFVEMEVDGGVRV